MLLICLFQGAAWIPHPPSASSSCRVRQTLQLAKDGELNLSQLELGGKKDTKHTPRSLCICYGCALKKTQSVLGHRAVACREHPGAAALLGRESSEHQGDGRNDNGYCSAEQQLFSALTVWWDEHRGMPALHPSTSHFYLHSLLSSPSPHPGKEQVSSGESKGQLTK